jgi:ABC-2 type transport system permease protein
MATISSPLIAGAQTADSLSKPTSAWTVCKVTIVKDLQMARRYVPDLIGRVVELAIRVVFFFLMSTVLAYRQVEALGGGNLTDRNLFLFLQGGMLLLVFSGVALSAPTDAVQRDLYNGTLEFLYSGPSSRYAYFVGTVLAGAIISQVTFIPLYLFFIFYSGASMFSVLMVLLVCLMVLATLVAMGIMIALLGLIWRQAGSLGKLIGLLFEFLAGAYLPLSIFPPAVQYIAYLLPYTWGYDLIRYYSFEGSWKPFLPVAVEWGALVFFAVFYGLLSRFLLKRAEIRAKKSGLHLL